MFAPSNYKWIETSTYYRSPFSIPVVVVVNSNLAFSVDIITFHHSTSLQKKLYKMATQSFVPTATISTKIYNYGYYPLLKGDYAPLFQFNREAFVSVQHYLDLQQPLVIAFYDGNKNNILSLNALSTLQAQVAENGGNLIVITNNTTRAFKKNISQLNNLTVFFDSDNEIAEKFGLFDAENPLSNWLSGIDDVNAALPALYVVSPDRQIVYHHIDYQFNLFGKEALSKAIVESLLDAVSTLATSYSYLSKWSKRLVS